MLETDDQQLLREFADTNSESAFAALVAQHVNLVYSTALRFSGNPQHAEEITQAVFIILARKAGSLGRKVVLSGWLYQTARLTAANVMKGEIRRQRREQEVYMQSTLNEPDSAVWEQIAPLLDDAMGRLGETDRNAVVLRFFENRNAREVAAALHLTEAAVHKRVNRALDKLRKIFAGRGVDSTTAMLSGAIAAYSIHTAPVGLAKTISAVALAKSAATSASTLTLVKGVLKVMAWTKTKTAVTAVVILALSATGVAGYKMVQTHHHTANVSLANDIQPDGTVYVRLALEIINTANGTLTPSNVWTMTMPITIQRFTDENGQPVRFTQKTPQKGQIETSAFLTRSVPPGKKWAVNIEGTLDGIGMGIIKTNGAPGVFEVWDGEAGTGFAMHCTYNYRLPAGAILLDKTPNLEVTASGGRIEMRFDQIIRPHDRAAYHFRYRLPAQAN
jgi:RNA polymerase sigma factor (sigma-70 family)